MAFKSEMDGSEFTNHSAMRRHENRMASAKGGKGVSHGGSANRPEKGGKSDFKGVADEHGDAEEVTIKHQDNKHTVSSIHPDGYMHEQEFKDAPAAHEAAQYLAGAKQAAEGGKQSNMPPEADASKGIPGLMGG